MHPQSTPTTAPAEPEHYTVAIPGAFAYATERELTIPAPHTADEIAMVVHAELTEFGYAHLSVDVDLAAGVVRIVWQGGPIETTITGPGVGTAEPDTAERTYLVQFGDHMPHFRSVEITSTPDRLAGDIHNRIDPGGNWDFEIVLTDAEDGGLLGRVVNDDGSESGYGTLTITERPTPAPRAEPVTDPRRIAYELVLAGVATGLPIPDSISIPSDNQVFDLRMADSDRDAVERWAAYLGLPAPADGDPIVVKPGRAFRSYATETWLHPAMPDRRRVQVASFCDLSDAEVAELEAQLAAGGTR
ncbi:hypothetical protein [Micromonospora sp. HUAS LYJ1]|uniref:hypothetical protein n=1 Tax=Micromonospora sp. HUAS LYJ1 TaxID=3061626 RepID=UPI0026712823|nr:hypothetical protein [Micromonospora sp. HUAS LYJ1]WKU07974.1 hypothetical protein Q2K16_13575 [Micromonospora sp. HUAS LYJ1]